MVYSLSYRRPPPQPRPRPLSIGSTTTASDDGDEKSIVTTSSASSQGIPDALSFDRIVSGGTCSPCTIRDFLNYLQYIEFSAENFQFHLWFRDYCRRFDQLPPGEKGLSPEWTRDKAEDVATRSRPPVGVSLKARAQVHAVFKNTDFADAKFSAIHETHVSQPSLDEPQASDVMSDSASTVGPHTYATTQSHRAVAESAFEDAGVKWKPFTMQPYRDEVDRVISIYIAQGSSRELNLSARERAAVLHALQHTTHPSAFGPARAAVESMLRRQSHPNFIRWAICNGNRPRVIFARGLGVFLIVAGLIAHVLLVLSGASRAWRVLPLLGWFIGVATLVAAWKGMCVVLHGLHHRHVRPWELFGDDAEGDVVVRDTESVDPVDDDEKAPSRRSFLSDTSNSFEDRPWVARYRRRNVVRKVFDRQVWIQEPALRQIQDTIFLQSVLASLLLSAIVVGGFVALPPGNFY